MSRGLVVITRLVGWGGMKRVAMMKEATFIKALISSLGKVWHMCGGVHGDRWCDVGLP